MNSPSYDQWQACWQRIDVPEPRVWYERLMLAYGEPHRHYHNQQHIAECLAAFYGGRYLAQQPAMVELALWFHDAVYDPRNSDSEERSADRAELCLTENGLQRGWIESVRSLIMATKHHETAPGSDAAVMIDVDLSILGQSEARFAEYERQIRQEYAWVPERVFASKRAEILGHFLARKRLFMTDHFFGNYEQQARRNLKASIARLVS